MSRQPSWWYNTEHFWLGYPHWYASVSLFSREREPKELTRSDTLAQAHGRPAQDLLPAPVVRFSLIFVVELHLRRERT